MHISFRAACLALCLTSQSYAATLVGLRFVGGPEESAYDIVKIDTETGKQTTLVPSAFQDLWGGSFVTDTENGVGYVAASFVTPFPNFSISTKLLRYDLTTGKVFPSPKLEFGGAMALGPDSKLVAVHATSSSNCDIVTLDPKTGKTKTLAAGAFRDLWSGSFISDRSKGIGYVINESRQLLRYSLSSGKILLRRQLGYGGPLALSLDGKLVGIRNKATSSDVVEINPETGGVTTLIADAFPDFYSGSFTTDLDAEIGCVLTSEKKIFVFNLRTGGIQAASHRMKDEVQYAAFGVSPRARDLQIIYKGKNRITTGKSSITLKGQASGKVTSVRFRVRGHGGFKKAQGTTNWTVNARLKRGVNVVLVQASGPAGKSLNTSITVVRN